jgi:SNF2 family DNA or RNA helicase
VGTIFTSDINFKDEDRLRFRSFINRVSGHYQSDEPLNFYGGIMADPMGLGKTLTMIALVATDLDRKANVGADITMSGDENNSVSATLVIVPPTRMSH